MDPNYSPCPCSSGMKFKFCCMKKSPDEILKVIGRFPIHECLIADNDWQNHGLAVFHVCRKATDARYFIAVYMVDTYCLGVKNTFVKMNLDKEQMLYTRRRLEDRYELTPHDYEDARSIILGALDYADALGFQPNVDWKDTRYLVEADRDYTHKFQFGKDGKPLYIPGPDDNQRAIRAKLATVEHHYYNSSLSLLTG